MKRKVIKKYVPLRGWRVLQLYLLYFFELFLVKKKTENYN